MAFRYRQQSASSLLFALGATLWAQQVLAADCDLTVGPTENLQGAITSAEPFAVLCLSPGRYELPSTLLLNQPITIQGPGFAVDPRPVAKSTRVSGDESSEAILDGSTFGLGSLVRILGDDVTLSGLELRGGSADLIESEVSTPTVRPTIRYSILHEATGDEAIQLRAATDALITHNHIYNTAGDGVNLCCASSGAQVTYNEIHSIGSTNGGIYVYQNGAGGGTFLIADNLIYDVTGTRAVTLGITNGADRADPGGRLFRNVIRDIGGDGVGVFLSDTEILANEVFRVLGSRGAVALPFAVDGVSISDNLLHQCGAPGGVVTYGISVGASGELPTATVVSGNCIEMNEGGVFFFDQGGPPLNAEGNFWESADGPSGAGSGAGQSVSANVDYSPYLASHTQCAPDGDGDGDPDQTDCAPSDSQIHHGADELCDAIDHNCDGDPTSGAVDRVSYYVDADGDGFGSDSSLAQACVPPEGTVGAGGDCDDNSDQRYPGADELCDAVDHNCDGDLQAGAIDRIASYEDQDGDGAGDPETKTLACDVPDGLVSVAGDCADDDALATGAGQEVCDASDNDCDGVVDNVDEDDDGFVSVDCGGTDCDERDYRVNPDATEACFDGIDNNCDGVVDDEDPACKDAGRFDLTVQESGCGCRAGGMGKGTLGWPGAFGVILGMGLLSRRRRAP